MIEDMTNIISAIIDLFSIVSYKKHSKISQFFIKFKIKIHEIIKTNPAIKNMNVLYRV